MVSDSKKIRLKEEQIKILSELPESGMGYQIVDITLRDGRTLKGRVVINSEFLVVEHGELLDSNMIQAITLTREEEG